MRSDARHGQRVDEVADGLLSRADDHVVDFEEARLTDRAVVVVETQVESGVVDIVVGCPRDLFDAFHFHACPMYPPGGLAECLALLAALALHQEDLAGRWKRSGCGEEAWDVEVFADAPFLFPFLQVQGG